MAAGKTAVGRALARRLKRRFVDADREIARAAGKSIPRLFAERGEAGFRRLETSALKKIVRDDNRVIALGGGAVLKRENVSLMRRAGTVIYLQAPFEVLYRRGRKESGNRPLWRDRRGLKRLLRERRPSYRRSAHLTILAGRTGPERLAIRIVRRLNEKRPTRSR